MRRPPGQSDWDVKRSWLERVPFHPLLFAANPILFLYSLNMREVAVQELLTAIGVSMTLTLFIMVLGRLTLKMARKGAAVATFLTFFCFLFRWARLSLQESWTGLPAGAVHAVMGVIWLLVLGVIVYPVWRARNVNNLTRILNVTGAFMLATALVSLAAHWDQGVPAPQAASESAAPRGIKATGGLSYAPDIYYIVLDQYPRADTLTNIFQYDNAPFLDRLRRMGFHVVERSASNYPHTAMSICSMLNLDYLDKLDVGPVREDEQNPGVDTARAIRHNAAFRFVRERGYRTVYLPPEYGPATPEDVDMFIESSVRLSEFHQIVLQMTPLEDLLEAFSTAYSTVELHRRHVLFTLDELTRLPHRQDLSPMFVYAHILCPHQPVVFGLDGEEVPSFAHEPPSGMWARDPTFKQFYLNQVAFISKKAVETVEAILSKSARPPVIILCSDHGTEFELDWSNPTTTNLQERMANLMALYLPGDGDRRLYPTMSNVNVFRLIFDYYLGADYPLLPDRSYISNAASPYKFILVPMEGSVTTQLPESPAGQPSSGAPTGAPDTNESGGKP